MRWQINVFFIGEDVRKNHFFVFYAYGYRACVIEELFRKEQNTEKNESKNRNSLKSARKRELPEST